MEGKISRINNTTDSVVDRINALPDSILGDILSFLPTKEAVATSILSKRWKFAWLTVHNLDFYYNDYYPKVAGNEAGHMNFVRFVDRVLLLIDAGRLNKFSLVWDAWTISSHVSSWINTAITRNVRELYLSLGDGVLFNIPVSGFNCDSLQSLELNENIYFSTAVVVCLPKLENLRLDHVYFESEEVCEKLIRGCPMLQSLYLDIYLMDDCVDEELDTPLSVFTCDSLQSLELKGNINVPAAIVVCLPRLENLKLHRVHFGSEEACEKLISGCPILNYLDLNIHFTNNGDGVNDYFTCIISSASLRRLDIYCGDRSRLKLKASSLEYLRLRGCISRIFVEECLSSLVEGDFDISLAKHDSLHLDEHDFLNNSIVEAVRAFDCAKILTLSANVMRALSHATISLSTEFMRLVKLEARYCSSLQVFIQSSCNLEALIIYQDSWLGTTDPHDHPRWNALVEVPGCLSNSLKKVRLDGYKGLEDEREMIRYMLKHGSVLEVMQISCSSKGDREKLELLQEICDFPRKSPACKVQFCTWPSKRQFKPLY